MFRLTGADKDCDRLPELTGSQVKHHGFSSLLELHDQHVNQRSICCSEFCLIFSKTTQHLKAAENLHIFNLFTSDKQVYGSIHLSQSVARCNAKQTQKTIWIGERETIVSDYSESISQSLRFKQ